MDEVVAVAGDARRLHQSHYVPVDAKVHAQPDDCNNLHKLHDKDWEDMPMGAVIANVQAGVHWPYLALDYGPVVVWSNHYWQPLLRTTQPNACNVLRKQIWKALCMKL